MVVGLGGQVILSHQAEIIWWAKPNDLRIFATNFSIQHNLPVNHITTPLIILF